MERAISISFAKEGEHVACGDLVYSLDSSGKIAEMITSQEEETLLSDQDLAEIRNQAIGFFKSHFPKWILKKYTVLKISWKERH